MKKNNGLTVLFMVVGAVVFLVGAAVVVMKLIKNFAPELLYDCDCCEDDDDDDDWGCCEDDDDEECCCCDADEKDE